MKKIIVIILAATFIGILIYSKNLNGNKVEYEDKIKSINLATDYEIDQVIKDIKMLKANTVNIPIVIGIPNLESNEMEILDYSLNKAIELVKKLNKRNINIILEPYPWIADGSKYETEYNPKDKPRFFDDWNNILNYIIKNIANEYDVYGLIVGSNFTMLEDYEDDWCGIIDTVKSEYSGIVTYKTSWWYTARWDEDSIKSYEKKLNNKLFSKVDMISIAAYFELSDKEENSVEELIDCLNSTKINSRSQNIEEEIYNFYKKYKKQIYFGELGFPRRNHAATQPWNDRVSDVENNEEQARCFEAYRAVFEDKDYIKGFSVFALGNNKKDKIFYPSKESIKVISQWY